MFTLRTGIKSPKQEEGSSNFKVRLRKMPRDRSSVPVLDHGLPIIVIRAVLETRTTYGPTCAIAFLKSLQNPSKSSKSLQNPSIPSEKRSKAPRNRLKHCIRVIIVLPFSPLPTAAPLGGGLLRAGAEKGVVSLRRTQHLYSLQICCSIKKQRSINLTEKIVSALENLDPSTQIHSCPPPKKKGK